MSLYNERIFVRSLRQRICDCPFSVFVSPTCIAVNVGTFFPPLFAAERSFSCLPKFMRKRTKFWNLEEVQIGSLKRGHWLTFLVFLLFCYVLIQNDAAQDDGTGEYIPSLQRVKIACSGLTYLRGARAVEINEASERWEHRQISKFHIPHPGYEL